jgi:protein-S-isoprenylcysteine O-methyltransferase Ste14
MEDATRINARPRTLAELIRSHRRIWEILGNLLLAAYSLLFMMGMLADFRMHHRASSLLIALFEGGVAWFSFVRPMPKMTNVSMYDWAIALLGSFVILFMRPSPQVHDHIVLLAIQLSGMCASLAGLFSLNKSFGLVAANRGVKTHGMYALVRHPIYAGYFISFGAYLLQNMTVANVLIYAVFVIMQVLRIIAEEKVLLLDVEYANYARKTQWRVLPMVF